MDLLPERSAYTDPLGMTASYCTLIQAHQRNFWHSDNDSRTLLPAANGAAGKAGIHGLSVVLRFSPGGIDAAILTCSTRRRNNLVKSVYAELEQQLGHVPTFLKTLAHSNRFLKPVADAYLGLQGESGLSDKTRELVILKTCRLDKCKPMIDQHTELAKTAGWTDEQLQAFDNPADSATLSFYDKDALRFVELVRSTPDEIPADFWTQLDNHYTSDQVVEMIILIGFYSMINRLMLALEI